MIPISTLRLAAVVYSTLLTSTVVHLIVRIAKRALRLIVFLCGILQTYLHIGGGLLDHHGIITMMTGLMTLLILSGGNGKSN